MELKQTEPLHRLWQQHADGEISLEAYRKAAPEVATSTFRVADLPADVLNEIDEDLRDIILCRDAWGVPLIAAASQQALFANFGTALAQDRLFQMEMIRRACTGTVSAVLGSDYLDFDRTILGTYDPSDIERQYDALSDADRAIVDSYASGINLWRMICLKGEAPVPAEYAHFGFSPTVWTGADVIKVFTIALMHRFANVSTQAEELDFVNDLRTRFNEEVVADILNQTNWLDDPDAPTTIDPGSKSKTAARPPRVQAGYGADIPHGSAPLSTYVPRGPDGAFKAQGSRADMEKHRRARIAKLGPAGSDIYPEASNMWLTGKTKTADSDGVLLNGPQFGWIVPTYCWDVAAHCPEISFVGSAYYGLPSIICGRNSQIGWGATSGRSSCVDQYIEHLDAGNPHRYLFKGEYLDMQAREEVIEVKGAASETVTYYSTVHGIVEAFNENGRTAYSRKLSWTGYEADTLLGYIESMKATSYDEWLVQAARIGMSLNWYYIDTSGNIGYAHVGKYPNRPKTQDPRLPANGDGTMEWNGFIPFADQPQVFNPSSGFIPNWNNRPASTWPNSGNWPRIWSAADRVALITDELKGPGKLDADAVVAVNKYAARADQPLRFFLPFMEAAVAGLDPSTTEHKVVARLKAWDGLWTNSTEPDRYDGPEPAIMQATLSRLLEIVLAADMGDWFFRYQATGYPVHEEFDSADIAPGLRIAYNALQGPKSGVPQNYDFLHGETPEKIMLEALQAGISDLEARCGPNIDDWFQAAYPMGFATYNHLGIPQTLPSIDVSAPLQLSRGTENNIFVATGDRFSAWDVCPPGESGTLTEKNGQIRRDRHYADQLIMFSTFTYKQLP